MTTGIVDVGGGMRGIYAAGILDKCMEQGIHFDCCIGVSAGSANLASYLAGQKGRNYRFYMDYAFRKEYMGMHHWAETGSYINFEYIYGTLSGTGGEDPLDYDTMMADPAEFLIVASDAETGLPRYFRKKELQRDDYRACMASSCVPGIDRPVEVDGRHYYDGALADCVPLDRAFQEGCDRVVLVLTKPADIPRTPGKDLVLARMIRRTYPEAAEGMHHRAEVYNAAVERARELEKEGKVLILSPDDISGMSTLKRNRPAMERLYEKGQADGEKIGPWLAGD